MKLDRRHAACTELESGPQQRDVAKDILSEFASAIDQGADVSFADVLKRIRPES